MNKHIELNYRGETKEEEFIRQVKESSNVPINCFDNKEKFIEEVKKCFHMSVNDAAEHFEMCTTRFKKLNRLYGIKRWPYRKFEAINGFIKDCERILNNSNCSDDDKKKFEEQLIELQNIKEKMFDNPNLEYKELLPKYKANRLRTEINSCFNGKDKEIKKRDIKKVEIERRHSKRKHIRLPHVRLLFNEPFSIDLRTFKNKKQNKLNPKNKIVQKNFEDESDIIIAANLLIRIKNNIK